MDRLFDPERVHLITHVETTDAAVHEVQCTEIIQEALVNKGLPPSQHLVDSAYIDAELLVSSHQEQGVTIVGPLRPNNSWQTQVEGAYTLEVPAGREQAALALLRQQQIVQFAERAAP